MQRITVISKYMHLVICVCCSLSSFQLHRSMHSIDLLFQNNFLLLFISSPLLSHLTHSCMSDYFLFVLINMVHYPSFSCSLVCNSVYMSVCELVCVCVGTETFCHCVCGCFVASWSSSSSVSTTAHSCIHHNRTHSSLFNIEQEHKHK